MAKIKFKLPQLAKNKQANIALYVLIIGLIIYMIYRIIIAIKNKRSIEDLPINSNTSTSSGSTTTSKVTVAPVYTDSTVFSVKTPYMKDKRVQWMQNAFNTYSKLRKQHGKSGDWGTISEDSTYGPKTAEKMYTLMSKKNVSWNEVRTRVEYLKKQLINQSNDPYGYNF